MFLLFVKGIGQVIKGWDVGVNGTCCKLKFYAILFFLKYILK